ncbi:unnamed protein product, partial [Timema podura]|nr:unnamed protein product [Timema podura]
MAKKENQENRRAFRRQTWCAPSSASYRMSLTLLKPPDLETISEVDFQPSFLTFRSSSSSSLEKSAYFDTQLGLEESEKDFLSSNRQSFDSKVEDTPFQKELESDFVTKRKRVTFQNLFDEESLLLCEQKDGTDIALQTSV